MGVLRAEAEAEAEEEDRDGGDAGVQQFFAATLFFFGLLLGVGVPQNCEGAGEEAADDPDENGDERGLKSVSRTGRSPGRMRVLLVCSPVSIAAAAAAAALAAPAAAGGQRRISSSSSSSSPSSTPDADSVGE